MAWIKARKHPMHDNLSITFVVQMALKFLKHLILM